MCQAKNFRKETKFLSEKLAEKVDFASVLPTKYRKCWKMSYRRRQKKPQVRLFILYASPKFSGKFKDIILLNTWSWLCNINNNNNNKVYLEDFQKGLQVLAGVSFFKHANKKPLADCLRVWRAFTPLTLSQVHNGPQVKPKKSGFPLNNNKRCPRSHEQWFYWLMTSWCSSDSVEKNKNKEIDEQSGRHIQRQTPQQSQ